MSDIETVRTAYSTYEIDRSGPVARIRRVEGVNDPTPRQGEDGLWQRATVTTQGDGSLLIDWLDKPGSTLTSPAVLS